MHAQLSYVIAWQRSVVLQRAGEQARLVSEVAVRRRGWRGGNPVLGRGLGWWRARRAFGAARTVGGAR